MHRALTVRGSITVPLASSFIALDLTKQETMFLFVCTEATESKLVILETSVSSDNYHFD